MTERLFRPVSSASLAAYRIGFGLLGAVLLIRFWRMGWIERAFTEPKFFFKYYGFEWIQLWPGQGIYLHFAILTAVSLCLACGLFTRVMSLLFFLGFTYIEMLDQSNYLNHYYLIALLAFINVFLPLNARWSLDNLIGLSARRDFIPAWALYWVRGQVGTVYFFAGLAKFGTDWLLRAEPLNVWLTAHSSFPVVGFFLGQVWLHYLMSWAGFLFDLSIPFWMSNGRTRPYAYLVVIFFHVCTYLLFPIGLFPFIMVFAAAMFFPADWPLKLFGQSKEPARGIKIQWRGPVVAGLALWFFVQWTMPFRNLLYPGNVLWTEEAMRFSWKVMIREKNTETIFRVKDLATEETRFVSPSAYLLRHQEIEMSGSPDMILQFAHFLKQEMKAKGRDVAVYADTYSSFNGRSGKPLIDPHVDLTKERESFRPKRWIEPAPETDPHRLSIGAFAL
ncbi:MAG TPA: HTTM domain-containing protein [Bdellovibrionales bacterium]|nr:HTTM domain-containing protein [Bdellovibrionales bacterium]